MKIIFLEDVPGTADAGEIRVVKNGFARNYLLPNGLAAPATPDQLERLGSIQHAAEEKRLKQSKDMEVVAKALEGTAITIEGRVGPTGRLYGAITSRQIAQELSKVIDRIIDHKTIHLGTAIHEPGDYAIRVHLYREVSAQITVSVIPEGSLEETATILAAGETGSEGQIEDSSPEITNEALSDPDSKDDNQENLG